MTRKPLPALLALSCATALTACGDQRPRLGAAPAEALTPAVVEERSIRSEGDVLAALADERGGRIENEGKLCAEAARQRVKVEGCAE